MSEMQERFRPEKQWLLTDKQELINRYPLDGKAPTAKDEWVQYLAWGRGITTHAVVTMWYHLRRRQPGYNPPQRPRPITATIGDNGRKGWTSEDVATLLNAIPLNAYPGMDSIRVFKIAEKLGRTRQAIDGKHRELRKAEKEPRATVSPRDEILSMLLKLTALIEAL